MISDAMKTVRQLVKEQRYEEARAILRTLDTPLAQSWLESLEGLGPGKSAKPARRWRRTLAILIVLILAAVGAIVYLSYSYQQQALAEDSKNVLGFPSQQTQLEAICKERGYTEEECTKWMLDQTLNVNQTPVAPLPNVPRGNSPGLPAGP